MQHVSLTIYQALSLDAQLTAMDPPKQVLKAGREIITLVASGGIPPRELISFVTSWIGRRGQQDRYGK